MIATTIKDLIHHLETTAPPALQEEYDNSGLLVGDENTLLNGILIALDCTEAVIAEAIKNECNIVVCHHPILFKGIKRLNGKNYIERIIIQAIKNNIAIYAIHTNLDNVLFNGVNGRIGKLLGITPSSVLIPKENEILKLQTYVPKSHAEAVLQAMITAGAGTIGNYSECSFQLEGKGTFKGNSTSQPFIGNQLELTTINEIKIEILVPKYSKQKVLNALLASHPYEEVAYDLIALQNTTSTLGAGAFGELEQAMEATEFLSWLKLKMNLKVIKHTCLHKKMIKKIAWCGGAGALLIASAKACKADVYITSDVKYHEFFDADQQLIIIDIGHYETEQYTTDLLYDVIYEKFSTFALRKTSVNTNPINYF